MSTASSLLISGNPLSQRHQRVESHRQLRKCSSSHKHHIQCKALEQWSRDQVLLFEMVEIVAYLPQGLLRLGRLASKQLDHRQVHGSGIRIVGDTVARALPVTRWQPTVDSNRTALEQFEFAGRAWNNRSRSRECRCKEVRPGSAANKTHRFIGTVRFLCALQRPIRYELALIRVHTLWQ